MLRLGLFLFALIPGLAAAAPVTTGTASFDFGYFCALEPVEEGVAEGTVSGTVNFVPGTPAFLQKGHLVPAQLGVGFGVHVQALPDFAGPISVYIEHPPMGPNGVTRQVWVTRLEADDTDYLGYSFDEDYELLTGTWTMTAESEGRVVYSVDFEVMESGLFPPVPCGSVPIS